MASLSLNIARRMSQETMFKLGSKHTVAAFRRAARDSTAYKAILAEAGVDPKTIMTLADFQCHVPIVDKRQTFGRFPLHQLCALPITPGTIHNVITSSGQGGRFAFGILSRSQVKATTRMLDLALDANFQTLDRPTFLINCLPMGVGFLSHRVTIAETSVREDMVVALIKAFGDYYEQIIVVCDPLFLKRLVDYAAEQGLEWGRHRLHFVVGEETFSESLRNYVGKKTGIDPDNLDHGLIGSTYGIGELAMNLLFETRRSIAVRRLAYREPAVYRLLYGEHLPLQADPMVFAYNPMRTFIETLEEGKGPFGRMIVTLTDPQHSVPLPRYDTGDQARMVGPDIVEAIERMGHRLPKDEIDLPLLALSGRDKDQLPSGLHVGQFKEMVCRDQHLAQALTGAFTLTSDTSGLRLHLQLCKGRDELTSQQQDSLVRVLPAGISEQAVSVWPYAEFPFAMTLDYERKLNYFVT
jgi:phenylacetate-CoA ligase